MDPITRDAPPLAGGSIAAQRWSSLTFLHWRVGSAQVAPLLPAGTEPDELEGDSGTTWVGLIPFLLDRASVLGGPPVPYFGRFVEVNVRLYARDAAGRRGVVFRSLESSRLAAVLAARAGFSLPYQWARTSLARQGDRIDYRSRRFGGGPASLVSAQIGEAIEPTPLDDFLTARWAMFTRRGGRTLWVPNEHEPWRLRAASLVELEDGLLAAGGFPGLAERPPDSVRFADGVTTRFGRPVRIAP